MARDKARDDEVLQIVKEMKKVVTKRLDKELSLKADKWFDFAMTRSVAFALNNGGDWKRDRKWIRTLLKVSATLAQTRADGIEKDQDTIPQRNLEAAVKLVKTHCCEITPFGRWYSALTGPPPIDPPAPRKRRRNDRGTRDAAK